MDRDGTKDGFDIELTARDRRRGRRAGRSRAVASARSSIWSKASSRATPTGVLAAVIFHFGEHTIAEAKAALAAAGITVRPAS